MLDKEIADKIGVRGKNNQLNIHIRSREEEESSTSKLLCSVLKTLSKEEITVSMGTSPHRTTI